MYYIYSLGYKYIVFLFLSTSSLFLFSDSFLYNQYNNHGVVGLINTPTARFFDEGVHGITIYDGTPDQKITITSNPYDWLEASVFYTNIQGLPYPNFEYQDYKDKGFNVKLRLKKEGILPALAIGLNDFAGTGFYSSEYIVSSYGIKNLDMHLGIGWGQLSGTQNTIDNPFGYLSNNFNNRPAEYEGLGGSFNPSQYFSGERATPFYGISYYMANGLLIKVEKDPTLINGPRMPYTKRKSDFSFGVDYQMKNFTIGAAYERGGFFALRFTYKNDPLKKFTKYEYQEPKIDEDDDKYTKLIKNLEENGIGVNKISETSRSIGLELTQFMHPNLNLVEQIISEATRESGINKEVRKDLKIANLTAIAELDKNFQNNSKLIYERQTQRRVNTKTGIKFRPFLASREEFFKGAILLENDTEFIIRENLFFNTNLKYSLKNNFSDLRFEPVNTFPAQVRSDIKEYLKGMEDGILVGRAQLDYHITPRNNHHLMFTAGILEDMFSGYGFEYLYFKEDSNYAIGFDIFDVTKRDYNWRFSHLDYRNITSSVNLYFRNYGSIPFDLKLSAGEYLAGDHGSTIEISRTLRGGVKFGIFATSTNVSTLDFGEGSFDKGIFFNIPIYGNFINYTWRPLTKDPGAKINRRNDLYNLLVRFKPIN